MTTASKGNEKFAAELMTRKLVTVRLEDSLRKCYQLMRDKGIRHLPVVDGTCSNCWWLFWARLRTDTCSP